MQTANFIHKEVQLISDDQTFTVTLIKTTNGYEGVSIALKDGTNVVTARFEDTGYKQKIRDLRDMLDSILNQKIVL